MKPTRSVKKRKTGGGQGPATPERSVRKKPGAFGARKEGEKKKGVSALGTPKRVQKKKKKAKPESALKKKGQAVQTPEISQEVAPMIQRSPLSDELARIWAEEGKGAFFDKLRTTMVCDPDIWTWVTINLQGDDKWLATNIMRYGPEVWWPLDMKIRREMKGWGDSGGAAEVMSLLRAQNGKALGDPSVIMAVWEVFPHRSYERNLAWYLIRYGNETMFPLKEQIILKLLSRGEHHIIDTINAKGIGIWTFEEAWDKWRHDDGRITQNLIPTLRGNRDEANNKIRLNKALDPEKLTTTLYHEVSHATVTGLAHLEEEIYVRILTEEYHIRHGLPPTRRGYRNPDGTVNEEAIRKSIMGSSHYNPSGKSRIDRWYVGEARMGRFDIY